MQRKTGVQAVLSKLISLRSFSNRQKAIGWQIIGQTHRLGIKPALKKMRKNINPGCIGTRYVSAAPEIMMMQKLQSIFSSNAPEKMTPFIRKLKGNLNEFNSSKLSTRGLIQSSIAFIK